MATSKEAQCAKTLAEKRRKKTILLKRMMAPINKGNPLDKEDMDGRWINCGEVALRLDEFITLGQITDNNPVPARDAGLVGYPIYAENGENILSTSFDDPRIIERCAKKTYKVAHIDLSDPNNPKMIKEFEYNRTEKISFLRSPLSDLEQNLIDLPRRQKDGSVHGFIIISFKKAHIEQVKKDGGSCPDSHIFNFLVDEDNQIYFLDAQPQDERQWIFRSFPKDFLDRCLDDIFFINSTPPEGFKPHLAASVKRETNNTAASSSSSNAATGSAAGKTPAIKPTSAAKTFGSPKPNFSEGIETSTSATFQSASSSSSAYMNSAAVTTPRSSTPYPNPYHTAANIYHAYPNPLQIAANTNPTSYVNLHNTAASFISFASSSTTSNPASTQQQPSAIHVQQIEDVHKLDHENAVAEFNHQKTQADQFNSAKSQYYVAHCYSAGHGVSKDINQAYNYYYSAANQNLPEAYYPLGICYLEGQGAPIDIPLACRIFLEALKHKDPRANDQINKILPILHAEADTKNAAEAQFSLGDVYRDSLLQKQNLRLSFHYFQAAAKQNHAQALFKLGQCYQFGLGVEAHFWNARECFRLAQIHGDTAIKQDARKAEDTLIKELAAKQQQTAASLQTTTASLQQMQQTNASLQATVTSLQQANASLQQTQTNFAALQKAHAELFAKYNALMAASHQRENELKAGIDQVFSRVVSHHPIASIQQNAATNPNTASLLRPIASSASSSSSSNPYAYLNQSALQFTTGTVALASLLPTAAPHLNKRNSSAINSTTLTTTSTSLPAAISSISSNTLAAAVAAANNAENSKRRK